MFNDDKYATFLSKIRSFETRFRQGPGRFPALPDDVIPGVRHDADP